MAEFKEYNAQVCSVFEINGDQMSKAPSSESLAMEYTSPTFPEDLERQICEVLLNDTRDMRGVMSLVASRFNIWTKPIKFHTVVVRRHNDWMQRLDDCILPNAGLIRALVLDLSFSKDDRRCLFSNEELSSIRRLLGASEGVTHLAVTWNIWAYLERECGALRLQSLYLIWDDALLDVNPPQLGGLQHPAALEDITIFAPLSLDPHYSGWHRPEDYLPHAWHCTNLAYVTYAAVCVAHGWIDPRLKGYLAVAVGERTVNETLKEEEHFSIKYDKEHHPNFATLYLRTWNDVLREWLNKAEGRESLLEHPPPRTSTIGGVAMYAASVASRGTLTGLR
ncbi:hypothetical protein C8R46DRAFT_1252014 [Mycena filopes]|nr:hypothetical protein C8R46DRAFT_1252014 [Mycena filopes]